MICNVCGSTETYLLDGIEYCRECSEQIKGSIDEVAGDESFTKKTLLSSPAKKVTKDKTRTLAPWLHFEAYNVILCKQVSALIKLGCSRNLKAVVFCLWAQYLQKCESAFVASNKKEFIPHLSLFASKRDMELLYGEGLYTNLKKLKRPYFRKARPKRYKKQKPKADFPVSSVTSCSEMSSDEISESSLQSSKDIKKSKRKNCMYSVHAQKLRKKGFTRTDSEAQKICISHMTMSKTLSFCQLGLLYTEDQLLLFDLIRLVNSGAVPYVDALCHLPTTMQMQSKDVFTFTKGAAPDIKDVSYTTLQLIDFLQLPKFKEPPLLPVAIRFVKDLNLPCELIPVLNLLIRKLNKNSDGLYVFKEKAKTLPFYEAQAMSVVAVALKMLFVLDGNFEVEHSEIVTKLNSICKDQAFFVWKDWQKQMALKEYLFIKKYATNDNTMNRLDSLCADRINASYPVNLIHQELTTLNSSEIRKAHAIRIELKSLIECLAEDNSIKRNPTSFPLRYELHCLMNEWKTMPLYKDTENIDFSFIGKDFSQHKLYYRSSAASNDPMSLLLSSLYESVKLIHITESDEYYENIIRTSNKYWSLRYKSRTFDFPSSFKWLFNFMCNYLQIHKSDFYRELRRVECKLIQ